ncbi:MAG: hypothetical protein KatS3mg078_1264 [Deltaproteobacteria bacterium]|jgi:hypothetical protein|nr:MAG: hypothetical protein KatS3mg078_1264 [Deltaproteobacteria bacterium]
MPVYEYECDNCVDEYNSDISALVARLNKSNASRIMKKNPKFFYIEVFDDKKKKLVFALGERGKPNIRRFRYKLKNNKILYLELKNFRFSELIYDKEEEKNLICPLCSRGDRIRRVFSTFKAIFDKRDRAPGPGDELAWHLDYKKMKDEEIASSWVGPEYLEQYFND